jgi:hypothetical protein
MKNFAYLLIGFYAIAVPAHAADRADLEGAQITGSRELPKVLYIVPWKRPLPTDLVGRPAQSLLDEVLAPVDREVFRREVGYHAQLQWRASTADTVAAPNAPNESR